MAIATAEVKMGAYEARAAFLEYRDAVRKQHSKDDEALMRTYGTIAKHRRVIDLVATMRQAGVDSQGRPKLAIIRADGEIVFCDVWANGAARFSLDRWSNDRATRRYVALPGGTFPGVSASVSCRARVPMIPPRLRPDHALSGYHILWEAEWINAPKDPLLLRRLGGPFFAVVAQWDLSPLEQAILGAKGPA